jgi:hypothetical protein
MWIGRRVRKSEAEFRRDKMMVAWHEMPGTGCDRFVPTEHYLRIKHG